MYYVGARALPRTTLFFVRGDSKGGCEIFFVRESQREDTKEAFGDRRVFLVDGESGTRLKAEEEEKSERKNERAKAAKNGDEEKEKERMEYDAPVDGARGARGVRQLFSLFTHNEGDGRRKILGGRQRRSAEFNWVPSTVVELLVAAVPNVRTLLCIAKLQIRA